jgi:hypothetical protein
VKWYKMPETEDGVPLPTGGFKEPAPVDDDEENVELPAETDSAPGTPLDDLMSDEVIEVDNVGDEEEDDEDAP